MPDFLSYHPELIPTPIIASFLTDGTIVPLYFKLPDGDRTKIDNVAWTAKEPDSFFFGCEYSAKAYDPDVGEGTATAKVVLVYTHGLWFVDTKNRRGWGYST